MIRLKKIETCNQWWIEIGNLHIYPLNYWTQLLNRLTGRIKKYKWYEFEFIRINFVYSADVNWCPGLDIEIIFLGLGLRFCIHDRSIDVEDTEDETHHTEQS